MPPDRLSFLSEFDRFYQGLANDIKAGRYSEGDFYLIIPAKIKSMDRVRREKLIKSSKRPVRGKKEIRAICLFWESSGPRVIFFALFFI